MAKIPGVPSPMGAPAESQGPVDSDNIGPLDERTRSGRSVGELSSGPKQGPRGEYLPARYAVESEVENRNGSITTVRQIHEDH